MSKHDASGQMAGYLYQAYAALIELLKNESGSQICIEKFDDISFMDNDTPSVLIQTKHQINKKGLLSDTSTDLWRTINSWCSSLKSMDIATLRNTRFHLLTTAQVEENSAAYYLTMQQDTRNTVNAQNILEAVANAANSDTNKSFYASFFRLTPEYRTQLINNIVVYHGNFHLSEARSKVLSEVRIGTLPSFENQVCERLEGWWFNQVIKCLCSSSPVFIAYEQIRQQIFDIASEYRSDSLPITVDDLKMPTDEEISALSEKEKIFIKQLRLIFLSNDRIKRAIRDYYNAFIQRSQWLREDLLYIDELEKYEQILIDEWNRLFLIMEEDLSDYKEDLTEKQKITSGRKLFNNVEALSLNIRTYVTKPFIMRGTYHKLANTLQVGWHVDFINRLQTILEG